MNLLQLPAKDAYSYARNLLDVLFNKTEQSTSVVIKTKKRSKPPLSPDLVEKLFGKLLAMFFTLTHTYNSIDCVNRRYKGSYDHTKLMTTLGQKCRDAAREAARD